jgi:hypothetical protein
MMYFKHEEVAEAALAHVDEVRSAFEVLCTADDAFLRSLQTTTKSVEATGIRLERWGRALGTVLHVEVPSPTWTA